MNRMPLSVPLWVAGIRVARHLKTADDLFGGRRAHIAPSVPVR
jgi:hypothetical protein